MENNVNQVDDAAKLLRRARKNLMKREKKSKLSIQSVATEPRSFEPFAQSYSPTQSPKMLVRQKTDSSLLQSLKLLQDGPPPRAFGHSSLRRRTVVAASISPRSTDSLSLSSSSDSESFGSQSPLFGSNTDVSEEAPAATKSISISKNQARASLGPTSPFSRMCRNTYKRKSGKTVKNAIYCAIVLEEWLKELAAISQEHSLLPSPEKDITCFPPVS